MSMKPIYFCSTLNFELLDNHGNPGSIGIVFLYKPGTDNLNFHLCVLVDSMLVSVSVMLQLLLMRATSLLQRIYKMTLTLRPIGKK